MGIPTLVKGSKLISLFGLIFFIVNALTINTAFGLAFHRKFYPDTFLNRIYLDNIHTVLLRSATWELSSPVIEAGSDQQLELHFDDLSGTRRNLGYTLIHCNADWQSSDLTPQEYLSGFGQGQIRELSASFNTTYDYFHYRLVFPEEDCMPVVSGNYALVVYDEYDPASIILIRRFYMAEKGALITARIKQPVDADHRESGQQLELTVNYDNSLVTDPVSEIRVVIVQNNRANYPNILNKPTYLSTGKIEYSNAAGTIFEGGNEFRSLDIKSMKYQSGNIASIQFQQPYYHVYLKTDEDRGDHPYFSVTDLNGGFFINQEKAVDKHTEADYVYVHFSFAPAIVHSGEEIFLTGGFTDWQPLDRYRMKYNPANQHFELMILLKQGLYDYGYCIRTLPTGSPDLTLFEGSHFETTNEYAIFVYYHDQHGRFDRILGYLPLK